MTLRRIPAQEALALGLVNDVVSSETLLDQAVNTAETIISACAPGALREIKNSLNKHAAIDWQEVNESLGRIPKEQWQEGLSAFLERRRPDYEDFWSKHA